MRPFTKRLLCLWTAELSHRSEQAAPLRGAVPGRASRQACGTYGADPARHAGPSSQQLLIARLIIALAIPGEAWPSSPAYQCPGHGRSVKAPTASHVIASRPLTRRLLPRIRRLPRKTDQNDNARSRTVPKQHQPTGQWPCLKA